jgi:hypothetical protein
MCCSNYFHLRTSTHRTLKKKFKLIYQKLARGKGVHCVIVLIYSRRKWTIWSHCYATSCGCSSETKLLIITMCWWEIVIFITKFRFTNSLLEHGYSQGRNCLCIIIHIFMLHVKQFDMIRFVFHKVILVVLLCMVCRSWINVYWGRNNYKLCYSSLTFPWIM